MSVESVESIEPIEIPLQLARELLSLPTGATHCEALRLDSGELEIYVFGGNDSDGDWYYVGSLWGEAWLEK